MYTKKLFFRIYCLTYKEGPWVRVIKRWFHVKNVSTFSELFKFLCVCVCKCRERGVECRCQWGKELWQVPTSLLFFKNISTNRSNLNFISHKWNEWQKFSMSDIFLHINTSWMKKNVLWSWQGVSVFLWTDWWVYNWHYVKKTRQKCRELMLGYLIVNVFIHLRSVFWASFKLYHYYTMIKYLTSTGTRF